MAKTKISVTIDNEVLAQIKEKAEHDDRSISQFITKVLKDYLETANTKN